MSDQPDLLCFHCGQSISDPPQIHELPGGGNCPGCVERVLAALPPILPVEVGEPGASSEVLAADVQIGLGELSHPSGRGPGGPEPPPEPA